MPLVSVITPLYRAEPFLEDLVLSLAKQTFKDFEWICVDDCSPDRSVERLEKAAAGLLSLEIVRLPSNQGPAAARNSGLRVARGRYVAFLDADDLWLPEKLERQVEFMARHQHVFTFHDYRRMSHDGTSAGALVRGPDVVDWALLHKRRGVGCLTVMLERSVIPDGLFPERKELGEHTIAEDFVAWARLLRDGVKAHRIPVDLARYRIARRSRSANLFRATLSVWRIYRAHERIPLPRAAWYFFNYAVYSILRRVATRPAPSPDAAREHLAAESHRPLSLLAGDESPVRGGEVPP